MSMILTLASGGGVDFFSEAEDSLDAIDEHLHSAALGADVAVHP